MSATLPNRDGNAVASEDALELEGPAWRFALDFYSKPGVAAALLTLQDEAGVDVIQALLTTYVYCVRGHVLSQDDMAAARAATAGWREATVLPLRRIRRHLPSVQPRSEAETLRREVKKAELLAEQIQIAMAERWLSGRQTSPGLPLKAAMALLVAQYLGEGSRVEKSLSTAIDTIVDAAEERARR